MTQTTPCLTEINNRIETLEYLISSLSKKLNELKAILSCDHDFNEGSTYEYMGREHGGYISCKKCGALK